jgi:hypothetical protein
MRKLLTLLALVTAVTAAAVAVGPAGAVQGGTPDTANAYPYVGLSVFYKDGVPLWRCSGTLISPRVYVTAGHCTGVDPTGAAPDSAQIWFSPTSAPRGDYPGTGSCAGYTGYPCKGDVGGSAHPHPGWNGTLTVPNTHDVGVVVLDTPYAAPTYGKLAPLGYLDSLAKKRGKQNVNFTVVGYGVQFERPNLEVAVRDRYIGTTQLQDLASHEAGGFEVRMTASNGGGTGGSGTCFGDSGGPVFHTSDSGVQYDVGDISWGTKYCNGTSAFFRLDTTESQSFINPFVR